MSLIIIKIITFLIFLMPAIIMTLAHSIFYFVGSNSFRNPISEEDPPATSLSIVLPIKDEPDDIVLGMIDHLGLLREELSNNYEIIIVSDDPLERANKLKESVEKVAKENSLNLRFIIRSNVGEKGRVGALNHAIEIAKGEHILILDIDSRPDHGYITKMKKCISNGYDACVGRWEGYWVKPTKIAFSVAKSMRYVVDTIYKGRASLNLFIFPLGSGTIFKKEAILKVGKWDPEVVQDDMHIGTKLMWKGYKIGYIDDAVVKVLVPSTFSALRSQQARWAFGAMETLRKSFKYIMKSPYRFYHKLEAITFLAQYIPQIFLFLSAALIPLLSIILKVDIMLLPVNLAIFMLGALTIYGIAFYNCLRKSGLSKIRSLRVMGSSASTTVALAPIVSLYSVLGLLGMKIKYSITPKGSMEERIKSEFLPELSFLGYLTILAMINTFEGNYVTALWVVNFIAGLIYIVLNAEKILRAPDIAQPGLGTSSISAGSSPHRIITHEYQDFKH
jgi:cellulose synthase/poly-beta-1,6-N-acetylglucosamine synthase-like glycosyltransferase